MSIDLNNLVTAGVGLAGTLIGSLLTYLSTRREQKLTALKERAGALSDKLIRAAAQVKAYHALEGQFAIDLAEQRGVADRTIKTEYRDRVVALGYVRPTWTEGEARAAEELAGLPSQEQ